MQSSPITTPDSLRRRAAAPLRSAARRLVTAAGLTLTAAAAPATAQADVPAPAAPAPAAPRADLGGHVDVDLEVGVPIEDRYAPYSLGVGGRLGWRFDVGPVWIQPEIGGQYVAGMFGRDMYSDVSLVEHIARAFGGFRLGGVGLVAGVIEPALFGHAGYGRVSQNPYPAVHGPAFDVGFALDARIVRHFPFGVHGAYNVVSSAPGVDVLTGASISAVHWLSVGVHAGASF